MQIITGIVRCVGLTLLLTAAAVAQPVTGEAERTTTIIERERTTTVKERTVVEDAPQQVRKAAIFVKNRAEGVEDEKVSVLEDLMVSRLTDMGFEIISREDVANAVATFADAGPNAGDATLPGADLDAILSNSTSATRLAQNLGADYVLSAAITTFGRQTKAFSGYGVETVNTTSTMRVTYKLLDAVGGGSVTAGDVRSQVTTRADANAATASDTVNDLLDDASAKLAEQVQQKLARRQVRDKPDNELAFARVSFVATAQDLNVPDVVKQPDGEYTITANPLRLQVQGATVEVNGVTVGSTPGPLEVPKGLNKLRITRDDFVPWERTVSFRDGQTLEVALVMTDAGRAKWLQNLAVFDALKQQNKLTDANIEAIRGLAQMLRQSGYKVDVKSDYTADVKEDHKSDINVNTTEGLKIEQKNQSLWQDVENASTTLQQTTTP